MIHRPVQEQIASLTPAEASAFHSLKRYWAHGERELVYDDYMLLRFLRASPGDVKFNVTTAAKVAENYAAWSKEYKIHGLRLEDVRRELEKKIYIVGPNSSGTQQQQVNKDGHATIYFRPSNMFPKDTNSMALIRGVTYQLTCMTESEETSTNGICILTDMTGWNPAANFSLPLTQALIGVMQGRFPCRIRRMVVYNAPTTATLLWRVVKPFMGSNLADKLVFVNSKTIGQEFPNPDSLPKEMGGKLDLDRLAETFIHYRAQVEK